MTSHTIRELPHNKNFQINKTKLQKLKISGTFKSCDLKFLEKVLSKTKKQSSNRIAVLKILFDDCIIAENLFIFIDYKWLNLY